MCFFFVVNLGDLNFVFFFQAEDGIRDPLVTGVQTCALPIWRELGADLSELEWIVTGYALTFAALMLIGGKLADAYGRRLLFVIGIVVFTGSSLACGLAGTSGTLITWRIVQGVGAALMNPATLSIIAAAFPPKERGTAIGIWV